MMSVMLRIIAWQDTHFICVMRQVKVNQDLEIIGVISLTQFLDMRDTNYIVNLPRALKMISSSGLVKVGSEVSLKN